MCPVRDGLVKVKSDDFQRLTVETVLAGAFGEREHFLTLLVDDPREHRCAWPFRLALCSFSV